MISSAKAQAQADPYDVIVVGGGPGGSTAARYLAHEGLRTLLVDKEVFPRDKACGDVLPGACLEIVGELGLGEEVRALSHATRRMVLRTETTELRLENRPYLSVPRRAFDDLLFKSVAARVDTLEGARVEHVGEPVSGLSRVQMTTDGGARLERDARFVIGADGYSSVVARRAHRRPRTDRLALSVRGYWKNVAVAQDELEFYYLRECSPGYVWVFPARDGLANIGLYVTTSEYRKHPGPLRAWLERLLSQSPLRERLEAAGPVGAPAAWSCPLAIDIEPLYGDDFVLVGDAGGLVDPFWGHGIDSAMVSGKLAAVAVADVLCRGVPKQRAMQGYTSAVVAHFGAAWGSGAAMLKEVAALNALLGGTPLEHIRQSIGARDAVVTPLSPAHPL